jgi:hypothetical protein
VFNPKRRAAEQAERDAAKAARQAEEAKKPVFRGKPKTREQAHAKDRFRKALILATRPGTPGEGEAAEAAARRILAEGGFSPLDKSLNPSAFSDVIDPLLEKLRAEHRLKYRQRVV